MTDAYRMGYRAGYNRVPGFNPYAFNTQEYIDWGIGYEEGIIDWRNGR